MRIAVVQHTAGAGAGAMQRWLDDHHVSWHHLYRGDALPALADFELLLLLGGSLSVRDELQYLWMVDEKRLIDQALLMRKRVFGAGFGAQMLAQALGAGVNVSADGARIGWWPLEKYPESQRSPIGRMLPQRLLALQWQTETCTLPANAIALYGLALGELQGFVWQERAVGLLCHLECDSQGIEQRLAQDASDLQLKGYVQNADELRTDSHHAASANATLFRVLDYLSGAHAHMT